MKELSANYKINIDEPISIDINKTIQNFKNNNNKKIENGQIQSVQNLIDWAQANRKSNDADTPFIYEYIINEKDVYLFLTSLTLLKNAMDQAKFSCSFLMVDATYKLNVHKYALVTLGTMSKNRHYHLLGLSIVNKENTDVYNPIFSDLKKSIKDLYKLTIPRNILYLMTHSI